MSELKATTEEAVAYLESIGAPITEDRILWAKFLATQPTVEQVNIASSLVIEDRQRHLSESQEWQPIETAPKDGTHILFGRALPWSSSSNVCIGFWADEHQTDFPDWHTIDGDLIINTNVWCYWMPLPSPPATVTEDAPRSAEDVGHPRVGGLPCICSECVSKRGAMYAASTASVAEPQAVPSTFVLRVAAHDLRFCKWMIEQLQAMGDRMYGQDEYAASTPADGLRLMDEARAKQIVEAWETTLHSTSNHDASRGDLIRRITEALTCARTEGAADMAQRCAEVARSVPWSDSPRGMQGFIVDAILALSPDPSYASRIRGEVLDALTETVHQMFKDHGWGGNIPNPRDIRPVLDRALKEHQ